MESENEQKTKEQEYLEVFSSKEKHIIKSSRGTNISSSTENIQNIPSEVTVPQENQKREQERRNVAYIYLDDARFKLGQGSYGAVYKCYTKQHNKIYRFAVKVIKVPEYNGSVASGQDIIQTTRQEIKTLTKFKDNPNIIKIQDLIRDQKIIYLVLQYCNDKDIISYFKKLRGEGEEIGRTNHRKTRKSGIESIEQINSYMGQLLNGFKDLSSHNITHRDFKPGNVLVSNGVLKIADFGQSKPLFYRSQIMNEFVGTLCTSAPQIKFKQDYTAKCDIYSLGIVYYWMIYNKYPFKDMLSKEEYINVKVDFSDIGFDGFIVTEECKKLIRSMIAYKEEDRPEWNDLFSHRFFARYLGQKPQITSRVSFDRGMTMIQSQDFNQQIPEEFYKYVSEEDIHMNRISVDQYQDFISIMRSINCFNLKITFFKQLLRELCSYNSREDSETRIQEETLCDIIRLGIQKYTILLNKELQSQITFKDIPKILDRNALKSLQYQQKFNIYSKNLLHEIHSFQESQQKPKLSRDKITQLIKKCQQYKINEQFQIILRDSKQGCDKQTLLAQTGKSIIQLIFLLKPQIKNFNFKKRQLKTSNQEHRFKYLIILVHHLNMFVMNKEVFYNKISSISGTQTQEIMVVTDFLKREKFQDREAFHALANQIQFLLDRFQE